jgi:hypothetical protein
MWDVKGLDCMGYQMRDCGSVTVAAVALAVALFALGMTSYLAVTNRGVTVSGPAVVMPLEVR